jgi:hypothetical protein
MKVLAALHFLGGLPTPGFVLHSKRDGTLSKREQCLKEIGLVLRLLKRVAQLDSNRPTTQVEGVKVPLDRFQRACGVDRVEDSPVSQEKPVTAGRQLDSDSDYVFHATIVLLAWGGPPSLVMRIGVRFPSPPSDRNFEFLSDVEESRGRQAVASWSTSQ